VRPSQAAWHAGNPPGDSSDIQASLRKEEALRGERFAWNYHWVLYVIMAVLLLLDPLRASNPVVPLGIAILAIPIGLNFAVTRKILSRQPQPWLSYAYTFLDLTLLTLFNALDTYFNSTLTPVTTVTMLIYPILLFLAALQNDRLLIVLATLYTLLATNILFAAAYPHFDQRIASKLLCADLLGQVYRSFFLLLFGGLLLFFPATLRRLLEKQKALLEQNMEHFSQAHHDELTGLANRRMFSSFLEKIHSLSRRHKQRFAILFLDLDGFKKVNDTLGHDAGDAVLRAVASRLLSQVRTSDLAARFGGDEFALIASQVESREGVGLLSGRILTSIREPIPFHGEHIHISASIGIALFPDDGQDADQLVRLADDALYRVKRNGKDGSDFA